VILDFVWGVCVGFVLGALATDLMRAPAPKPPSKPAHPWTSHGHDEAEL